MSELVFQDVPRVELLQWLARGSLKQNLLRAMRLWVWLRSLYGDEQERIILDDSFTYAQWRDAFFNTTHPKGEEIPHIHDANCNCAKTTAEWLFQKNTGIVAHQWQELLLNYTGIKQDKLQKLLQQRLFGVTRRSLQGDLEILAELGWLIYKNEKYHRVSEFPTRPFTLRNEADELKFLHEDLVEIAQNHAQKINGVQRFFLQLDYVIPSNTIDLVSDWQYQLKQLWAEIPVPPIKLVYDSAKIQDTVNCIVYPVCIYYMQRAVYLCAYGESPDRKTDWYNFRLDRIQKITSLAWSDIEIPQHLHQCYRQTSRFSPDYIAQKMSEAWGFDFYLPANLMLLRFDRDYNDRYIKNTFRHETFTTITYEQAQHLICSEVTQKPHQQALLKILANRSPQDAYYQVFIRYQDANRRDNNVIMRLRAWRPKCEVILPYELRQSFAADIATEYQLYYQD